MAARGYKEFRQDIQKKLHVDSNDIFSLLGAPLTQGDLIEWMDRDRNHALKLQRLFSSETPQAEIVKLFQIITPSSNPGHYDVLKKSVYINNQSFALSGGDNNATYHALRALFGPLLDADLNKLSNLKCHIALKSYFTKKNGAFPGAVTVDQLVALDAEIHKQFLSGGDSEAVNTALLVKAQADGYVGADFNVFEDEPTFYNAKQQALYRGIWGEDPEIAIKKMTEKKKAEESNLSKLKAAFKVDQIEPFRADSALHPELQARLGGIISVEQYERYLALIKQVKLLKSMPAEELQSFLTLTAIDEIINQITSLEDEITKALEICEARQDIIDELWLDFKDRDLRKVDNEIQRKKIFEYGEPIVQMDKINQKQIKELQLLQNDLLDAAAEDNFRKMLTNLRDKAKTTKPLSARLAFHSEAEEESRDFTKDDDETEEHFLDRVKGEITRHVGGLVLPEDDEEELGTDKSSDYIGYQYEERQDVGAVRVRFFQKMVPDPDDSKSEVHAKAAYMVRRHADGSQSYQVVHSKNESYEFKASRIFETCYEARANAELADGQEGVDPSKRQPKEKFIIKTKDVLTATLYYVILTKHLGLDEKNFFCKVSMKEIQAFYKQQQKGIDGLLEKRCAADEKSAAWSQRANRVERVGTAAATAGLFARTATCAQQHQAQVQQSYDDCVAALA